MMRPDVSRAFAQHISRRPLYVTFSAKQDWIASTVDSQSGQHYGLTQLVMTATPTLCSGQKSTHALQLRLATPLTVPFHQDTTNRFIHFY